jgi:hypothetical protein
MKPHSIGRALGIGLRVAGRIAGQRMGAAAAAGSVSPSGAQPSGSGAGGQPASGRPAAADQAAARREAGRVAGQAAVRGTSGIARGVGGFLRPFRRVGGILWLEVTGAFFMLFVVAFVPAMWRSRASWAHGPDHRTFLVSGAVVGVFLYLSVSSFWRARRK